MRMYSSYNKIIYVCKLQLLVYTILCILFLTLKGNMHMIHMDATLAEQEHSTLPCGIYWPQMWPFILIASLESLNYKHTKVLAQQR